MAVAGKIECARIIVKFNKNGYAKHHAVNDKKTARIGFVRFVFMPV
jgi:hypothetical protein